MLLAVKRPRRRTGRNGAGRCNFSSVLSVTAWDLGIYGDSLTCANRTEEVRIYIYIYSRLSINLSLASLSPLLHKKTNKQIDKDRPKAKNLNGISNFEFKQLDYSCENVFLRRTEMDPKAARVEWPRIRYFRSHCSTNLLPPSLPSPYAQPLKNIHIYILKVFLTVLRNTKEIHHTCISSESVLDRISSSFPLPQILLTLQREIRIKSYKTRP